MLPTVLSQRDEKLKFEYSEREFPEERIWHLLQHRMRNSTVSMHDPSTAMMLEPKIRRRILKSLLITQSITLPTSGLVDAAILRANKQLNAEAVNILYGENRFSFYRPDVLLNWLNMIGKNITKVREMSFSLTTGNFKGIGVPEERLWLSAVTWLAPLQQLTVLHINLTAWLSSPIVEDRDNINVDERFTRQARNSVVDLVTSFKNEGLIPVAADNNGSWLFMRQTAVPL